MIDTKVKAILFDLDGTLLPMDMDVFIAAYGKAIGAYFKDSFDPQTLVKNVLKGVGIMAANAGKTTNYQAFWGYFSQIYGKEILSRIPEFTRFYETEFNRVKEVCGFNPYAGKLIPLLKEQGYRLILSTNPLFPSIATENRARWAGMNPGDFELITHYENSRYCKPNLDYYRDILSVRGLRPEDCIMVGNDVGEDMCARELGMQVFLVTDCLINRHNADISQYPQGSLKELYELFGGSE